MWIQTRPEVEVVTRVSIEKGEERLAECGKEERKIKMVVREWPREG